MHYIKELDSSDIYDIKKLDNITGYFISEEVEADSVSPSNYHAYGIYTSIDSKDDNDPETEVQAILIGYCSIDNADSASSCWAWNDGDIILSEFFILEEYRKSGYGTELIEYILHEVPQDVSIFLNVDPVYKSNWCEKFGFTKLDDGSVIRLRANL